MGNQKQKWTEKEEDALLGGIKKHGPGKWKNILKDPEFSPFLTQRSNIDLKDKWRNLSVSNSSDKSRTPKALKAITFTPLSSTQSYTPISFSASSVTDFHPGSSQDRKIVPRYNAMIIEALSCLKEARGSSINAIVDFIERRYEVPQNFRRLLSSRLRRLVAQGKLEKVDNCYRLGKDNSLLTKMPTPRHKDVKLIRLLQNPGLNVHETVEEIAIAAAYKVAEAENKSFVAAEAIREAERVSLMAEETESMLQFVQHIYKQCQRDGAVWLA